MDHSALMDTIYRHQRRVYDITRSFLLPGRDRLLNAMDIRDGDRILEVGCGTARNLIRIACSHPGAELYGLDASEQMLRTANRSAARAGVQNRLTLRHGLAENLDPGRTFGTERPFDIVFFSYSLTMMPDSTGALDAALESLAPGGAMYIVDFGDMCGMPPLVSRCLRAWLGLFHVRHRAEVVVRLEEVQRGGKGRLSMRNLAGHYAYLARFATSRHVTRR